jgi:hypothetical protein
MDTQRRHFLLLVTLAASAATPALAQDVGPAIGPARTGTQTAASIPDFSGLWTKPYIGIELPLSGPSPVVNKSRMRQLFDIDGRRLPAASAPLVSSVLQLVGDYSNPILKAEAAEVVKKNGEMELRGTPVASARNQCWPEGVPYVFRDLGILLLQQPDKITIVYDYDHHVRRVRLNQPHPA